MSLILGIETSCDETAAAVIADGRMILSNVIASQIDLHRQYGGVFPEMASRQHVMAIGPVIQRAIRDARVRWEDLDAIAVTYGPGLAGSLLVGVNAAKGLAYGRNLPLIGVNHLEAHIATNWLDCSPRFASAVQPVAPEQESRPGQMFEQAPEEPFEAAFPLLCLIVSGGHTDLVLMRDYGVYEGLGSTIDDAAGEAFDKVARLLELDYPGGPAIQRVAEAGNAAAFDLPRARLDRSYDFSFSGLKTAVLRTVQRYDPDLNRPGDRAPTAQAAEEEERPRHRLHPRTVADLAASFQISVVEVLVEKTHRAAAEYEVKGVLMAGGVAANRLLRTKMGETLTVPLHMPPVALATDNATGVGVVGEWALRAGRFSGWDLDVVPRLKLA
jgi:N6-L-threonylcarbamoyladenine synthase